MVHYCAAADYTGRSGHPFMMTNYRGASHTIRSWQHDLLIYRTTFIIVFSRIHDELHHGATIVQRSSILCWRFYYGDMGQDVCIYRVQGRWCWDVLFFILSYRQKIPFKIDSFVWGTHLCSKQQQKQAQCIICTHIYFTWSIMYYSWNASAPPPYHGIGRIMKYGEDDWFSWYYVDTRTTVSRGDIIK